MLLLSLLEVLLLLLEVLLLEVLLLLSLSSETRFKLVASFVFKMKYI